MSSSLRNAVMTRSREPGFTLVELMVAMTISLFVLLVLVNVLVNLSRTNDEMAKTNSLIENGRFTIQILQNDLAHVGYWGGYVPQFDDLIVASVPGDVPTATPDPCLAYAAWTSDHKINLLGIPVQSTDALPAGTGCISFPAKRAGTDVIVVRHAEVCVPGAPNCELDVAGRIYLQNSLCEAEKNAGNAVSATSHSIVLNANAAAVNGAYTGVTLRIASGTGMGQMRNINAYDGASRTATLNVPWTTIPDATSVYSFEYALGTSVFPLHKRDCQGTGTPQTLPITAGALADKRRMVSNIYYIADLPHPDRAGETVPTLMRSQLDLSGSVPAQVTPVRLLDGVEAIRVELGIDNLSKTNAPVDYTEAVEWVDVTTKTQPTNRGDGAPDLYKRCTTAAPCTTAELMNVVAVKLYVLARSRDVTAGHTDTKEYCVGEPDTDGSCPAGNKILPANDHYKRHVFTTSVRLSNISGRRETPAP